ncbi:hypothetical protein BK010_09715 [Tenericutes bacterium MO-XQ]|nr:hypothetical protein BK010_09715 [Tenericutes bacterium MO-XQ]
MSKIKSATDFDIQEMTKDAVVFNLLQIGELSHRKLTDDFKNEYKDIPWHHIYGLRNKIVHDYDHIHSNILFETITDDLQVFVNNIKKILGKNL